MDRSVGRNEDKGGQPRSGDSELSFRGIIHVVCQANGRAGKLAGARNIAFSSASPKKRKPRYMYMFFFSSPPIRIRAWRPQHRQVLHSRWSIQPRFLSLSLFAFFPSRASLFEHLFFLASTAVAQRERRVYVSFAIALDLVQREKGGITNAERRQSMNAQGMIH